MYSKKREPAVLTVAEVAEILRLGRISVYQAIQRGDLPALRLGRRIIVPRAAFEIWLASKPLQKPAA
jgi:excisionase family DNA binding protein